MDHGESLQQAAIRETWEEAGVKVQLRGVLGVQAGHHGSGWRRIIFYGEPQDEAQLPKTQPDFESAGAVWVSGEEVGALPWRSLSETRWFGHLVSGGAVLPLAMPAEYWDSENARDPGAIRQTWGRTRRFPTSRPGMPRCCTNCSLWAGSDARRKASRRPETASIVALDGCLR